MCTAGRPPTDRLLTRAHAACLLGLHYQLRQLYMPEGFAHGYLALSEVAEVAEVFYKVSAPQSPGHEHTLAWNDATLAIDWPAVPWPLTLSPRDAAAPALAQAAWFG